LGENTQFNGLKPILLRIADFRLWILEGDAFVKETLHIERGFAGLEAGKRSTL
jgi:hypothetical protein